MTLQPYAELRARIAKFYPDVAAFGKAIDMNVRRVNDRLNGKVKIDVDFIEKCCSALDITPEESPKYFIFLQ